MLVNDFTTTATGRANSTRWNINQFVNGGKKRHTYIAMKDLGDDDAKELDRIIRSMDLEYSKINGELDRYNRDLVNMGSQLKNRISNFSTSGEPGEVEIQYRKMEMDIAQAKSKIAESKIKLFESKLKQIRDERKLIYDRYKANGGAAGNTVSATGAAPSIVQVANGGQMVGGGGFQLSPEMANIFRAQLVNSQEVPKTLTSSAVQQSQVKIDSLVKRDAQDGDGNTTFQVETSVTRPTIDVNEVDVPNGNMVLTGTSALGYTTEDSKTLSDQYKQNMSIIQQREANKKKMLAEQSGVMGAKMDTSLKSIINQGLDIKEKVFVDKNTGKYWMEGYIETEDGRLEKLDSYLPKSILHIGNLRFDVKNQLVKTSHYDESVPFEIADENDMNAFYAKEWNKESSNHYVLPESTLELLQ